MATGRGHRPVDGCEAASANAALNQAAPANRWWSILLMMVSPGQVLAQGLGKISWPFALGVSGAAFALFFFQTGLDRSHVNSLSTGGCAMLALVGAPMARQA